MQHLRLIYKLVCTLYLNQRILSKLMVSFL